MTALVETFDAERPAQPLVFRHENAPASAAATERRRTIVHREWTLPAPASVTDVTSVLEFVAARREADARWQRAGEVTITAEGELLVLGYAIDADEFSSPGKCTSLLIKHGDIRSMLERWERRRNHPVWLEAIQELTRVLDGGTRG